MRAAATHHLPSLAHPHHQFCVPTIQSAEGAAERREGGREGGRLREHRRRRGEETRRSPSLLAALRSADVVRSGGTLTSHFLSALLGLFILSLGVLCGLSK